ncbi:hypothetical protein M422DRAFT_26906 [Sphaerobolus stellatus SS14]|nr:hypothetical protein M422DRAFT_26906 [Sphaerobolus stellatus SS14]
MAGQSQLEGSMSDAISQTRKSYAQIIKDRAKPRPRPPITLEASTNNNEDDWTDVSSVTSCDWPRTPTGLSESGSIHSACEISTVPYVQEVYQLNRESEVLEMDSTLWEESIDTRAPQVLAGRIKHKEKSNWRYRNLTAPCKTQEDIIKKPWKEYPGCSHRGGHWKDYGEEKVRKQGKKDLQTHIRSRDSETETTRIKYAQGKPRRLLPMDQPWR